MKKILIAVLLSYMFGLSHMIAQKPLSQIKVEGVYGSILKHTKHLERIVQGPTLGFEIDYEMFSNHHSRDWHGFFNFPKTGVGAVYMNLGNDSILGNLFALYPYFNFSLINTKAFKLNLKTGAGVSYLTRTFNNALYVYDPSKSLLNQSNAAIGSKLNVWFVGGGNIEVPLFSGISLIAGAHWNHASNGSFLQPNSGLNMINYSAGISFFPQHKNYYPPISRSYPDLKREWGMDITLSGGVRELYYADDQMFPTGSVVLSLHRQLGNRLRLGLAFDGFYDGVYAAVNSSAEPAKNSSKYMFTYLTEDLLINRFRAGVSLQPEFVFGRLTAGIHFGVYLFNPIKNLEPYADAKAGTLNKPLIYAYNIEKEHGWLYTRASLKYLINKHLFLNLGLKTHLQKAEFIEWGIGYRL